MSYLNVLKQLQAVHRLQTKTTTSPARRESLRELEGALIARLHRLKN